MTFVGGIICLLIGLIMAIKPDIWYEFSEQWKSDSVDSPSDFYVKCTRIRGAFIVLVGVVSIIITFFI